MLTRAIYVSDAVGQAGATALSRAEILGVAIRNNRQRNITGVLLFHDGRFLQAVEGAGPDVERLLDQLRQDDRHQGMRVLFHAAVPARRFGGSPMAQGRVTPRVLRLLAAGSLEALSPEAAEQVLDAAAIPLEAAG